MNKRLVGPPPDEKPPEPPPELKEEEEEEQESAPPDDSPVEPSYLPPAADAEPAPAVVISTPRSTRTVVIAVILGAVLVVAAMGYAGAGYAFSSSRLDSARSVYNDVVTHQNTITDEFNNINSKLTAVNLTSSSPTDYQQSHDAYVQLVGQSEAAQPTITADDASLAAAQSRLNESAWLTVLNRSNLNQVSAKIGHERNALASAKTITGDMVQLGTFFQSYDDAFLDLDTVSSKEQASDFPGAAAAIAKLKTDTAKAIQLSGAPGLPPEMKQLMTDMQTLAVDNAKLLDDAIKSDANAAQADVKAVEADVAKLEAYNYDKIISEVKSFYQPLIDAFNSEVAKANSM
ncbi:MAG: hypothetical protein E6I95_09205 [Chloroflexi bacterium]|nr:MAG: hypothetical protein E6I95_09205 [Chloroflexota bacterium]